MNGSDLMRAVDTLYREKAVPKEIIFSNIEKAIRLAIQKRYDDEEDIAVNIDRQNGQIVARKGETVLAPEELGRIAAGAAKQFIIQGIKEEESNSVFQAFQAQKGDMVTGTVQRFEGGGATVSLGKSEAFMPRGEMIPGETHHPGERVKAIILDVRKQGHRVKIILSRNHPDFVRRLFEEEIPEIQEQTISIKAVAREAGYRTKVAISSIDMKVDCVGACVGVRGSRIKNIVEELGGERIDIVRWNDSLQVLIPNSLQPAQIEEVFLYNRLGRAIVLVNEDQLSLAIGRRGQNVRLGSKLVGWDIEIMTHDELNESIERAENWFRLIPGVTDQMVEVFIEEGFLSYDDLHLSIEPAELAELVGITEDEAEEILIYTEEAARNAEQEAKEQKKQVDASRTFNVVSTSRMTPAERAAHLLGGDLPNESAESVATDPGSESSLETSDIPSVVDEGLEADSESLLTEEQDQVGEIHSEGAGHPTEAVEPVATPAPPTE